MEPCEEGLVLKGVPPVEETLKWLRERRLRFGPGRARPGELAGMDLEKEFQG